MRVCPRCSAVFKAQVMSCSGDGTTLIERQDDPHLSSPLGRFILESLIADGVTGRIYRAQAAVVRVLYGEFGTQELIVKRLFRELEAAKELQHPNVARILEVGTDDGSTWIASELAAGESLDAFLAAGASMDLDRVGSICAQIAAALAEAHDADLLHRNLSPNNVMIAPKGKRDAVKVLDFGLGWMARSSQAIRFRTRRDYAAPEATRVAGGQKSADVFSLGLIAKDLISKAGNGKTELGALVAAMADPNPGKRPQTGRDVLSRLDDLGYSPIAFPGARKAAPKEVITHDLKTDLSADGLVLVGTQSNAGTEATVPTASPDALLMEEGIVVVTPPSPTNTTFVYRGGQPPSPEPIARDEIDIEASRRKLGFLENDRARKEPKEPKEAKEAKERKETTSHRPLLARAVVEKVRTPLNGTESLDPIMPVAAPERAAPVERTAVIEELQDPRELTTPGIEVTASQMIDEIDTEGAPDDVELVGSGDIEPVSVVEPRAPEPTVDLSSPEPTSRTRLVRAIQEEIEDLPVETPSPTLLSAADLSEPKAVGGISSLPAEHPERAKTRTGSFRPKGSWPTEDLVLPSKTGAAQPTGFGDEAQRAPTSIIRTRGVFSSEYDVPDRPGYMSALETDVVRPRSPSGDPLPRPDTLPIDRASTILDPAEGPAGMSGERRIKARRRRSLLPFGAAAAILTIAAVAIALPHLDGREKEVRRPVLIQAQPETAEDLDDRPLDMAALDALLPAGDEPAEAAEAAEGPLTEPAAEPPSEPPPVEAPPPEKKAVEPPPPPPPPAVAEEPKPKQEPVARSIVREVEEEEPEASEDALPEGDEPAREKKKREKKKQPQRERKRSSAKAAPKKELPEKLERGTLIDPFAE